MSRVTIKSIAQDLDLGRNTVSMAIKGDPRVSEETRRKVISYAASLGYAKLTPCTNVLTNNSDPIRVLVIRRLDQTAYWDRVINGVSEEAARQNCIINISVVTQEDVDNKRLPFGYSEDIDACIFLHKFGEEYTRKILNNRIIGIFLDCKNYTFLEPMMGDVIKSEGRRSMMQITQSLIAQGMTKIGYLCPYYINAETFCDRYEGFCAAMREADLPVLPQYVVTSSPYQDKTICYKAALDQFPDLPEAIVCVNDDSALKISGLLIERGVRIPEDVAITGFDNDEYDAFTPFFTTVNCNAFHLGKRTVQQLIWRMDHLDTPFETITVDSTPIYRRSSQKK